MKGGENNMTKRKAIKLLNQVGQPLSKNKKKWISDKKVFKAVAIIKAADKEDDNYLDMLMMEDDSLV